MQTSDQPDYNTADPVEQQHVEIVSRLPGKHARFQPLWVVIQEVAVYHEVEACPRGDGVKE